MQATRGCGTLASASRRWASPATIRLRERPSSSSSARFIFPTKHRPELRRCNKLVSTTKGGFPPFLIHFRFNSCQKTSCLVECFHYEDRNPPKVLPQCTCHVCMWSSGCCWINTRNHRNGNLFTVPSSFHRKRKGVRHCRTHREVQGSHRSSCSKGKESKVAILAKDPLFIRRVFLMEKNFHNLRTARFSFRELDVIQEYALRASRLSKSSHCIKF